MRESERERERDGLFCLYRKIPCALPSFTEMDVNKGYVRIFLPVVNIV